MKNLLDNRQTRRSKFKKALRFWKLYISIAIVSGVVGYIILLGTIQFTKQLFNITAHAPTHKVYATTKVPEPTPTPVIMAEAGTQQEMITIIKRVWRRDWKTGVAIASCESGLRPTAVNRNNKPPYEHQVDVGLFQIGVPVHKWSEQDMLNPVANAGFAYALFNEQGYGPWKSSEKCWRQRI